MCVTCKCRALRTLRHRSLSIYTTTVICCQLPAAAASLCRCKLVSYITLRCERLGIEWCVSLPPLLVSYLPFYYFFSRTKGGAIKSFTERERETVLIDFFFLIQWPRNGRKKRRLMSSVSSSLSRRHFPSGGFLYIYIPPSLCCYTVTPPFNLPEALQTSRRMTVHLSVLLLSLSLSLDERELEYWRLFEMLL